MASKNLSLEGLNWFHGASLTLKSDVDHDTKMFGLHQIPLLQQGISKSVFYGDLANSMLALLYPNPSL